jgi:hypothetical protein
MGREYKLRNFSNILIKQHEKDTCFEIPYRWVISSLLLNMQSEKIGWYVYISVVQQKKEVHNISYD